MKEVNLNRQQLESIARVSIDLYLLDFIDPNSKEFIRFEAVLNAAGIEK